MNTKLEENLPIAFKRKPIYNTKQEKKLLNDTASSSDQSSTSTLKNEEEEVLENSTNAEVKVIRYLNPHKFYVTQDVKEPSEPSELTIVRVTHFRSAQSRVSRHFT